jgi:hypothetical protein
MTGWMGSAVAVTAIKAPQANRADKQLLFNLGAVKAKVPNNEAVSFVGNRIA